MLNYQGSIQNREPYTPSEQQAALADLGRRSPYVSFGRNHQDVLRAVGEREASGLAREMRRTNIDYALAQQQAQRDLALSGLTQASRMRQDEMNLDNQRLQTMVGGANTLLRGLFG